mmetsp:Transcript_41122/g.113340  ORF Transcript_41122/g.113340 Transcript_41122/m.113340 type:complete len:263 (+) Transcript_41122:88-876(+)
MGDGCKDLAFIRITLLGAANSGKTSLANAFVNNVTPATYQPNDEERLFYVTMRLAGSDEDSNFNVICEIEDTVGSNNLMDTRLENFYDLFWPRAPKKAETLAKKDIVDHGGQSRSILLPFGTYQAPLDTRYRPLTNNRMAYFLMFDTTDQKSYLEALRLHKGLLAYWQKKELNLKPVVFLVGNKIDKDPGGETFFEVSQNAHMYSEHCAVPYFTVSATQYTGVKKLFRTAVQTVRIHQSLWLLRFKDPNNSGLEDDKNCGIQ